MKQMPKIHTFMTLMPHTVGRDISIKTALELMREYHVRHLPVQEAGKLIGVLTDRDLKLAASFDDAFKLTVEEVMTPDPYTTSPQTPLSHVIYEMEKHKYGCTIVQNDNGRVIGIFTAIDALRVLGEHLRSNYRTEKLQGFEEDLSPRSAHECI